MLQFQPLVQLWPLGKDDIQVSLRVLQSHIKINSFLLWFSIGFIHNSVNLGCLKVSRSEWDKENSWISTWQSWGSPFSERRQLVGGSLGLQKRVEIYLSEKRRISYKVNLEPERQWVFSVKSKVWMTWGIVRLCGDPKTKPLEASVYFAAVALRTKVFAIG